VILLLRLLPRTDGRNFQGAPGVTETTPRSAGQLTRRLHSIPNNVTWESCPSSFTKLLPSAAAIEGLDDLYAISLESRRKPHKRLFPLAAGDLQQSGKFPSP